MRYFCAHRLSIKGPNTVEFPCRVTTGAHGLGEKSSIKSMRLSIKLDKKLHPNKD